MAFYVSTEARLKNELLSCLQQTLGTRAVITPEGGPSCNKLRITFLPEAGFGRQDHKLTEAQIRAGVCGGGLVEGLDGRSFLIIIQEIL
jgi:hypothetical protein